MQKQITQTLLFKSTLLFFGIAFFSALFLTYQNINLKKKTVELIELRSHYLALLDQLQNDKKKRE